MFEAVDIDQPLLQRIGQLRVLEWAPAISDAPPKTKCLVETAPPFSPALPEHISHLSGHQPPAGQPTDRTQKRRLRTKETTMRKFLGALLRSFSTPCA